MVLKLSRNMGHLKEVGSPLKDYHDATPGEGMAMIQFLNTYLNRRL
jgi:hypothetical protein